MNFAENSRISHRQLYRQMILSFAAPFFLCLFSQGRFLGIDGLAGTVTAVAVLLFYVIFLIRLTPGQGNLVKAAGGFWGRVIGLFFLSYVTLTAAYLLRILEKLVPASLVTGVPGMLLSFLAVAACSAGTHKGMQRRGRMAEVSGGLVLGALVLMMILSLGQANLDYLRETAERSPLTGQGFLQSFYGILCAFAGLGLLPFALGDVEKNGSAGKAAGLGVLTLGGLLAAMELILPAVFGWDRLTAEEFPVLPLLAGADLPGNVLARFDVLWMGFLLYSLLFSIGSLFHYGHQILRRSSLFPGKIWMAVLVYFLSVTRLGGKGIENYYEPFLAYVFVPGMLLAQVFLFIRSRSRRKKKLAVASVLSICLFLGGCGVEPEKRTYPLALGVQVSEAGFSLIYGMPDLPQSTGQEKPDEGAQVLLVQGKDFKEIEERYNRTQEKYLDMGHLQALILGDEVLSGTYWQQLLDYLEQEPFVGENVYVFSTDDVEGTLAWKGAQGNSVGEYLVGMYENRTGGKRKGVTLRQLYYEKYRSQTLPDLPRLTISDGQLYLTENAGE